MNFISAEYRYFEYMTESQSVLKSCPSMKWTYLHNKTKRLREIDSHNADAGRIYFVTLVEFAIV